MFSRSSKKIKSPKSTENLLEVDVVFEKSLTMEEEKDLAGGRLRLMAKLIESEEKYIEDLNHIIQVTI